LKVRGGNSREKRAGVRGYSNSPSTKKEGAENVLTLRNEVKYEKKEVARDRYRKRKY